MATPIGHSLAGLTAMALAPRRDRRPLFVLALVMANLPDLDFLPGLLVGRPALHHQGISHSLGVAAAASLVAALVLRQRGIALGVAGRVALVAYTSHLALDLVGPDSRPPIGIPLLWPLSDAAVISPVTILAGFRHAGRTDASIADWLGGMLDVRNVGAVALEAVLLAPLAWLAGRRCASPPADR
jgi:membrane-bound metal-dependent hydrolase YbcI (DUF457 family)